MMKQQNKLKQRQAVSGVIAAVVLIGITVSMGALVLTFGTDFTQSVLVIEPIDVKKLTIKNTGDTSYVHATVKNSGTNDLEDLRIIIIDGGNEYEIPFASSGELAIGLTTSVTKQITDTSDDAVYMPYGKEVLVQIKADTNFVS